MPKSLDPEHVSESHFEIGNSTFLFIDRFVLLSCESRIEIPGSSAVRNIAGHIAESTGLLARGASIRHGISRESITTARTLPLRHLVHLPFPLTLALSLHGERGRVRGSVFVNIEIITELNRFQVLFDIGFG